MKHYLLLVSLLLISLSSTASNLIHHEQVKNQQNCFRSVFADYDSWRAMMKRGYEKRAQSADVLSQRLARFDATFGKEKFEHFKNSIDCRTFEYEVDSHNVKGYVIKPKTADKNLPTIIYNRGGNGNFGGVVFGAMMHHLFPIAQEGFVIIGSQYRGTHTKTDNLDEFGGADVKDVTALLDFIPAIEGADPNRVGMYGASRGGMQTHLAVKQAHNIKAIATKAGNTDLSKWMVFRPEIENVYRKRIPNYEENKQAERDKRSVVKWVDQLSPDIPILILHGTADKRVPVENSKDLAAALAKHNIPHKLVLYPDDNHGLTKNRKAAREELVNWFRKHL